MKIGLQIPSFTWPGGPKITLSTDVGDLRIKKGSAFPATPPLPSAVGAPPKLPPPPANAPHLKAPKTPVAPVAQ